MTASQNNTFAQLPCSSWGVAIPSWKGVESIHDTHNFMIACNFLTRPYDKLFLHDINRFNQQFSQKQVQVHIQSYML